jgi:hypothetical protein
VTSIPRSALFISHANPEDNAFARWLGAKLAAMGYEVWADVMDLHGGADWARQLETALRKRSIKMLLVANAPAFDKQGVRNEVQIGSTVGRKLKDDNFIIPLRLGRYEPPFLIAQSQFIDFSSSWALGFAELVDTLEAIYAVPRGAVGSLNAWHQSQSRGAGTIVVRPETLHSNWLRLLQTPSIVRYFEPPSGFPLELFQRKASHRWPVATHGQGVLTFGNVDESGLLGLDLPAREIATYLTADFLESGWPDQKLAWFDARAKYSDIANQAFERVLSSRGLVPYGASGPRQRWWGGIGKIPLTQIPFNWQHRKGRRQVMGQSGKRGVFWHYAINGEARSGPIPHFRIYAGLVFSTNGMDALDDVKKMHRLRRSFAKWRNARWRDMMLAFLWWLSNGESEFAIPVAGDQIMSVALPPMGFRSPVTVRRTGEDVPDEDDPDVDDDREDDDVIGEQGADEGEP